MILIDTCLWIESICQTPTGKQHQALWSRPDGIIVPTLLQFELRRWANRALREDENAEVLVTTRNCQIVGLTEAIALLGADYSTQYKLPAIDAMMYATAMEHNATLITCDSHFEGLPFVDYHAKLTQ